MLKYEDIFEIVTLRKHGLTIRDIAQKCQLSTNTVMKYSKRNEEAKKELLQDPTLERQHDLTEMLTTSPTYDSSKRRPRKWTQEVELIFISIMNDEGRKDRLLGKGHKLKRSAKKIYELMQSYGCQVSYSTVCNRVRRFREHETQTFIKQEYEFGYRFEFDFGSRKIIVANEPMTVYLAVIACPASGYRDYYVYTNSRKEVFMDAMVRFFEEVGGSFKTGVFDNMRNVVKRFIGKNERELTDTVKKLSLYYGFDVVLTNPYSGNEKGTVEDYVRWTFDQLFVEKYEFKDFQEVIHYCEDKKEQINSGCNIEEERKHLLAYRPPMECAITREQKVNKYSFIRIDRNDYSVPEELTGKTVKIKLYPNNIEVFYERERVLSILRQPGEGKVYVELQHYLHTLLRKPGALANSVALKNVPALKTIFNTYYSQDPRDFLVTLLDNKDNYDTNELAKLLTPGGDFKPKKNKVEQKAIQQVIDISSLFIKGDKDEKH